jgi:glyoxylase-like metal-dependent hydrolase (beta-lactamase superfamily II)
MQTSHQNNGTMTRPLASSKLLTQYRFHRFKRITLRAIRIAKTGPARVRQIKEDLPMNKYRNILINAVVAFVLLIASPISFADESRAIHADYPLTKLSDRIYVIYGPLGEPTKVNQGFRNNIGFVLTSAGVVVVDPGTSVYVGRMALKKIHTVTRKPVVAVFNTHVHGDHWLGNEAFKDANPKVNIYAHANMIAQAKAGEGERWIKMFNDATGNAVVGTKPVVPNVAVKDGQVITIGDVKFKIHYTGLAHSDNDIMIELPQEKAIFTGDIVRAGLVSILNASFQGNIKAVNVALQSRSKLFIPGHGKAGGKMVAITYRDFLVLLRSTVAKNYDAGIPDYKMKPFVVRALADYQNWSGFKDHIGRLISLAYLEVEEDSFK